MFRTVRFSGCGSCLATAAVVCAFAADPAVPPEKPHSKPRAKSKAVAADPAKPAADSQTKTQPVADPTDATQPPKVYYAPAPEPGQRLRAKDYPIGITVLGKQPEPIAEPRLRIRIETVPPAPPTPLPDLPPISLEGVVGKPLEPTAVPSPVGAFTEAVQRARRAEFIARTTVSQDKGDWSPTPAYSAGDPTKPYPWNPSTFSAPIWSQTWSTASTWPPGQDLRNWSPVRWTAPIIDPVWLPHDAWDRTLELETLPPE
ncbi:MAG: hypothetical protein U0V87_00330 [Acidobacteriota bacterium]